MPLTFATSDRHKTLTQICQQLDISETKLVSAEQVHGQGIAVVSKNDLGKQMPGVDALITTDTNVPLVIRTADCAPILIFDPEKKVLALVHAGRKGTELKITDLAVKLLFEKFKCRAADLEVEIGPCIDKCCYPTDLRQENFKQLLDNKIPAINIMIEPSCTKCNKDKYYSYRGDGPDTGRNFLVAML